MIPHVVKTVNDFRDLVNQVRELKSIFEEDKREAEMAFMDIRHFCEIRYPKDRRTRTKVCQLIRDYSIKRRKAKDILRIIEPLAKLIEQNPRLISEIGKATNEMNKEKRMLDADRHYNPRILEDLFKE